MMAVLLAAALAVLPPWEMSVVSRTAAELKLTREETALLCAIRRAENGRVSFPSLAYGVTLPRFRASYATQCRAAAVTIQRRYKGDLCAFARRWLGGDEKKLPNWLRNVRFFMRRQGFNVNY